MFVWSLHFDTPAYLQNCKSNMLIAVRNILTAHLDPISNVSAATQKSETPSQVAFGSKTANEVHLLACQVQETKQGEKPNMCSVSQAGQASEYFT